MANLLTRKVGPLPVWAYAGIAVGGYLFIRSRQNAAASASSGTAATDPNALYGGELSPEYDPGYGGQFSLTPDSLLPVSAAAVTSGNGSAGSTSVANAPSGNPGPQAHPIFNQSGPPGAPGEVSSGIPAPGPGPGGQTKITL